MLQTDKIVLRAPEMEDVDFLYRLENEGGMNESGFTTAPLSRFQLDEYVRNYNADIYAMRQLRFVIVRRHDNQPLGCIDLCDYEPRDRRAFVSIALLSSFRGQGYGREALTLICDYACNTLGMHQLAAQIAYDNEASHALFSGSGFRTCGSLRSWLRRGPHYVDALLYQLLFANN